MDLKELNRVNPESHWYYQAKLVGILKLIKQSGMKPMSLVDVGSGSGFFGRSIQNELAIPKLFCIDTNYIEEWSEPGIYFKKSSSGCNADLYLFIDVLEHVVEDRALLKEYYDKAPSKSIFIITVPAFMSLWSGHDVYLEHVKRYRVEELQFLILQLEATTLNKGYFFSSIFPIAWIVRKLKLSDKKDSNMRETSRPINAILKFVTKLEHKWTRNQLFGLSAYISFKKP